MSKDIYGIPNRHYGSEPDTKRDEEAVTEAARHRIAHHGFCPDCRAGVMPEAPDAEYEAWADAHAETCTPLRELVVARMEADRE